MRYNKADLYSVDIKLIVARCPGLPQTHRVYRVRTERRIQFLVAQSIDIVWPIVYSIYVLPYAAAGPVARLAAHGWMDG